MCVGVGQGGREEGGKIREIREISELKELREIREIREIRERGERGRRVNPRKRRTVNCTKRFVTMPGRIGGMNTWRICR